MLSNPDSLSDFSSSEASASASSLGDADRVHAVSAVRGECLGAQHRRGCLLGCLHRGRPPVAVDLEPFAFHCCAVGVLPLHQNEADGRRCDRQAEYRVHEPLLLASTVPGRTV